MIESWASELDLGHIDWPLGALIFLDFDGVLHPESFNAREFIYLPLLEDMLRRQPRVGVVLTSSWREERSFDRLRAPFSADVRSRILACAPVLPEGRSDGGRGLEIDRFFELNALRGMPFVILDDEARLFQQGCSELYEVDSGGLTEIDIRRIEERLAALLQE